MWTIMFSLNVSRDVDVVDMDWEVQRRHITLHDTLYPKTFRSIFWLEMHARLLL